MRVKFLRVALGVVAALLCGASLYAQNNIPIKGRVLSESGQPVAKATIQVKGRTTGVSSDDNGTFELVAPSDATLVISSVGYAPISIRIAGRPAITITLAASGSSLDQVVVVGYGTQRKKDVTGSVVSVNATALQEVPTANVISELKGRAAGVDIISNSATPGGGGQIRIRGNHSLAPETPTSVPGSTAITVANNDALNAPLLVVDGIPYGGSINDLNPDDIISLDILKDASATAIYGSRGSGGVILISTRRGKSGKAITSYNAYYGISNILGELKTFNGPEYAQFKADAAAGNTATPGTTAYPLTNAEQAGITNHTSTDWQKLIYQQGFTTNNALTVSGGNETTQFSLGAGYYKETGIIPNQKFERYSLRSTIDHRLTSRLKIGLNTLNTLSYTNTPGGSGIPGGLMRLSPLTAPHNADGTVNMLPLAGSIDATTVNPLTLKTASGAIANNDRRIRTFNSLYGEWQILQFLKYRVNVGLDFRQDQAGNYSGPNTWVNTNTSLSQATESVTNAEAWTYTIDNLLTYDQTFREKHHISFTGLYGIQKDHNQGTGIFGQGIPADYIQYYNLNLANSLTASNSFNNPWTYSERGLISYMGRLNYSYDNRYLFTATLRRDGASVLSPGHQYFTYPALAFGWNIANEKFMNNIAFVSELKLRGGWGKTSNQGVAPYTTLGALSSYAYNFGTTSAGQQAGYLVTTLGNQNLHWESTSQYNGGLEFGLFKSRITGSVDVYYQRTTGILLGESLPPSNGAGTTTVNAGITKGHGVEISLSSINVRTHSGFTWSTDLNFFLNREEIVQLQNPALKADIGNGWFVGQPMTVIYDVKKIGIWQSQDAAQAAGQNPSRLPGQIRIQDLDGNGKIDANDRQIIGNFQPKWEGGLTNRFAYKAFDLSVVMFARMGMKVEVPYVTTDGSAQGYDFFMQARGNQLKVDYWTPANPTNKFPRPDASTDRLMYASTLGYVDGSFIKVRSINLGYNLPSKWLNRAGISSLRVYATVANPFILYAPFVKDGYGPDPEGNGYGGAVASSVNTGTNTVPSRQITVNANSPSTRQYNIGLNLKF